MGSLCHQCGTEYEILGSHWSRSSDCEYPEWSDELHEVTKGLLMGDAHLSVTNNSPRLEVKMITPEYLEYIDALFGNQGTEVRHYMSAEESANQIVENGLRPEADPDDYSDVWRWNSISTPELNEYREWYDGEKVWPDDIELTPQTLKHWYAGDGCLSERGNSIRVSIGLSNESHNKEKVLSYFDDIPVTNPTFNQDSIRWTVGGTEEFFDYIGDPLPGFEYKWPTPNARP